MSEVWQTIEQAAVTLGLSVRTVNRHITGGKLQSRLFEGRREVLVALPDEKPRAESVAQSSVSATSGRDGQGGRSGFVAGTTADEPFVSASTGSSAVTAGASDPYADHASRESFRQTSASDFGTDKSLDGQTMLALADSIDDKATLAVAAYQTLARSAETQVQSLRRVAFGAWAVVGMMAAGLIVAVGWATHRLTTAEVTATNLSKEVDKQATDRDRLAAERDRGRAELQTVQQQAHQLRAKLDEMADRAAEQRANAAEMVQFAVRYVDQARATAGPTTAPTTAPAMPFPVAPPGTSATAAGAAATSNQVGAPNLSGFSNSASRPAAFTATRPAGQRGQLPANTEEAFGTK